jgi:hypothetical protein
MDLKAKFEENQISPGWLKEVPENILNVLFETGAKAKLGNLIKPYQAKTFPCVLYWPVKFAALYTILIVDLDWLKVAKQGNCLLLFLVCNVHANDVFKGKLRRRSRVKL